MSLLIGAAMLVAVFATSMISGIFGMAGGLILLGILLLILPVGTAIAVQGMVQLIANGSRAFFSRAYIDWRVLGIMTLGLLTAAAVLFIVRYTPDLATVCITIGLLPILLWIPQSRLALDASKPHHAFICGFLGGGINLAVGVAGPTIDMFFIRTPMDRRTIIATKAAAQCSITPARFSFTGTPPWCWRPANGLPWRWPPPLPLSVPALAIGSSSTSPTPISRAGPA
ncbi:TSUP family transporter [Devosia sp. A8/3-2]|nr:TSUP family transporter [Devosia sp. A8/3-2]